MIGSPMIVAEIKDVEKLRLKAYKPTPNDKWTCGYGCTGPDIGPSTVWTEHQAEDRFTVKLAMFAHELTKMLDGCATTQAQFDAMLSLIYNIGAANLKGSTLLAHHKAASYKRAAAEFPRWRFQKGEVLNGLIIRRAKERALYEGKAT